MEAATAAYYRLNQSQAENHRIGHEIQSVIEEVDISNSASEAKEEKRNTSMKQNNKRSLYSAVKMIRRALSARQITQESDGGKIDVEFKNMFEGHYVTEPFDNKLCELLAQFDTRTRFNINPRHWCCHLFGVPSVLTFFAMPCFFKSHRKLFWHLQPVSQPFEKMNMSFFGLLPLYYLLFGGAMLPILFDEDPSGPLPWLWVAGTALMAGCTPLVLAGTPIIIVTAIAFNHSPRTHTRQFFKIHTDFLSSLVYVAGSTLWWSLVGLTLRYVSIAIAMPRSGMPDDSATVCSLATQAINASKSSTQVLDCKQEGDDLDPHVLYKTIVLASGWLLGMTLSLLWAVAARRMWEIHYGNSPEVDKLLQELASYPDTLGKQVRHQKHNKVGPAPTPEVTHPKLASTPKETGSNDISNVNSESETVENILRRLGLMSFLPAIQDIGGTSMVHLVEINDEDLQTIGMKPLHRRSLLQALPRNKFSLT